MASISGLGAEGPDEGLDLGGIGTMGGNGEAFEDLYQ
ncbi:hypothetical protein J2X71_005014, partial [Rhizobium sp. 1399]|nr:hypothetical protein [Rhizobium sp. 1399]